MAGGEVSETVMMTMCSAAAQELKNRLREGIGAEEIKELFVAAAGVLALSMYIAGGTAAPNAVRSFRAGSLSVTCAGAEDTPSAASLRRQAERMLSAYLRDEGFAFMGVRG